jgi:alkanesulfonate monooxygenase SsuD/methylene tetrahydromethanopterin reductase-like flavin-dependent oxidoreductase (luciferase family)
MDFSTMVLTNYIAADDGPDVDERVMGIALEESLLVADLGYNPWFTEHHFRGPWHSNPTQFAAYVAPQIPADRYIGFGVISVPFYHPVRLVETMNMLDQLTKGRTLYGLGSGFAGNEPTGMGLDPHYHASGQAARDTIEVMEHLWDFKTGDPEYRFELPMHRGLIRRRVVPAPYRKRHPTIIRTASSEAAVVAAARNGWPAFVGTGRNAMPLVEQLRLYRQTLAEANHPQAVVDECLRWCTRDWLSVVVADSEAEAEAGAAKARAEHLALRQRYIDAFGPLQGPVEHQEGGESIAAAFARGNDMLNIIGGTPDTIAERVQDLVNLGINHLLIRFLGEWTGETRSISEKSMRLFARDVMPRFKDIPPLRDPLALDLSAAS